MARFKIYVEYEGTRYSGWQVQKNVRTVQGKLLEAAEKIFKNEKVDVQGSGRTDAGVHALCQVAHLDVKTVLAPEIIRMKLNDELPSDINILDVEEKNFVPFPVWAKMAGCHRYPVCCLGYHGILGSWWKLRDGDNRGKEFWWCV